ncbi:MAG: hypothetical protein LUE89_06810 [Clostridiales bacterium]|nr:hypothetical protein [Clostridiales bacterium]
MIGSRYPTLFAELMYQVVQTVQLFLFGMDIGQQIPAAALQEEQEFSFASLLFQQDATGDHFFPKADVDEILIEALRFIVGLWHGEPPPAVSILYRGKRNGKYFVSISGYSHKEYLDARYFILNGKRMQRKSFGGDGNHHSENFEMPSIQRKTDDV